MTAEERAALYPLHQSRGRPKHAVPENLKQAIIDLFSQHGRHGVSNI